MFFLPSGIVVVVSIVLVVVLCVVVVVGVVCGETPVTTIQQWLGQRLSYKLNPTPLCILR